MALEKNNKAFSEQKALVIANLETLQAQVIECQNIGMEDPGDSLYNHLSDLLDVTEGCSSFEELEELMEIAKQIEHNLDSWLSVHGTNSMELSWPDLKPFLE